MLSIESYRATTRTFYFSLGRQICKSKKSDDDKSPHKVPALLLMVLICRRLVLILYLNLYYGSVRASGIYGGVESNPGPFANKKQCKHHTIRIIPDTEIQQGCSAQAMVSFLLCF